MRLRTRFMLLILMIFVGFSLTAWLYSEELHSRINEQWASQLAVRQVQFDKKRTLMPIIQEVKLSLQLASEEALINMARNEHDPDAIRQGLAQLERYRILFHDHSYFAAFSLSGHYYANNADNQYHGDELRYTLSPEKPGDAWFYTTLNNSKRYDINVNEDSELGVTKVWINVLLQDGDEVLGVIGTGIDITEFLNEALDTVHPDISNMFVNRNLAIQLHPDKKLINFASGFKPDEKNINLNRLFKNSSELQEIRDAMARVEHAPKSIEMVQVTFNGEQHLLGISYLPEIEWFDLTLMNTRKLSLFSDVSLLPYLLAVFFLIAVLLVLAALNYSILNPLARLQKAMNTIEHGEWETSPPLVGSGEILQLSHNFKSMFEFVRHSKQELEENVRRRTTQLQILLDTAPLGIWMVDTDGHIQFVNKTFCNATGISEESFLKADHYTTVLPSLNSESYRQSDSDCLKKPEAILVSNEKIHFADGKEHLLEIIKASVVSNSGEVLGIICMSSDITERRQLEVQLQQSQKMEAIGTLVGGIAHDFNNSLAAIKGNLYLARNQISNHYIVAEKLANIEHLSDRAADMVQQLLTFARKDMVRTGPFSLTSFIKEALKLTRTLMPESIEFVTDIETTEMTIIGDPSQLQQALLNLFNNARDATHGRLHPEIRCSLKQFSVDSSFLSHHPGFAAETGAHLTIQDNGRGIPVDELPHIFEPFFTTKNVGEGTGLGLAMVYGSLQTHGGEIEVISREDEGTTIHIYLPLIQNTHAEIETEHPQSNQGGHETILLVDDEVAVRSTTEEVLLSLGYEVISASDGEDALAIYNTHKQTISLIISDIVMPRMGGVELAKNIHAMTPDIPVILSTGYDKEWALQDVELSSMITTVYKPFSFEELSQLIRELIERSVD